MGIFIIATDKNICQVEFKSSGLLNMIHSYCQPNYNHHQ